MKEFRILRENFLHSIVHNVRNIGYTVARGTFDWVKDTLSGCLLRSEVDDGNYMIYRFTIIFGEQLNIAYKGFDDVLAVGTKNVTFKYHSPAAYFHISALKNTTVRKKILRAIKLLTNILENPASENTAPDAD